MLGVPACWGLHSEQHLLVKVRSGRGGTVPVVRCVGSCWGGVFGLLMSPALEDQERHLLVKVRPGCTPELRVG